MRSWSSLTELNDGVSEHHLNQNALQVCKFN